MKKFIALLMLVLSLFAVAACGSKEDEPKEEEPTPVDPEPQKDIFEKSEGVMTYAQYAAAELNSEVTIEAFVQAKQSWWDNKGTFYLADKEGGYFAYNMPCTEEEYNGLTIGTKVQIKGTKAEWAGEVEITDSTWTKMEGSYIATATDLTANWADLSAYKNQFAAFKGLSVIDAKVAFASDDTIAKNSAFLYKWNGAGEKGNNDDLYFYVRLGEVTYSFTVESYLCGQDTDVYKAVEALKVGDIVDIEGFVYYYNVPQVHVTKLTVVTSGDKVLAKSEGVMTYAQYAAAELNSEVTIEAFVQAKQSWWDNKGTFYLADSEGGYFAYNMTCTEEEYNSLTIGTKVQIKGTKAEWAGEVEITDSTWTKMDGQYIAPATDLTASWADLSAYKNQFAAFTGLTIVDAKLAFPDDESIKEGTAFLYKWNGAGDQGNNDDLYFYVKLGEVTYSFTVESYLCNQDTDVYKAVEALKVGYTVNIEGFVYYYNAPQVHVTSIKVVTK